MLDDTWRKSTRSGITECVEVRFIDNAIEVRDTKNRDGEILKYDKDAWLAFIGGAKSGEFDI